MGFHGYGGSELDHSDCLISPCSECNRQRQQPQPSVRSGNTCTDLTSNQDDRGSRANVFGHENSDRNATYRATGSDNAAGGADCAGNLSGGFHHLSISEEDRILRDEMRQSGFRIPSFSEDPASSHPVGNQNRGEDTVFECQNHPQPNDGRGGLSDEDRALRNEMRRSGFRIPSVSFDPTSGHPDGSLNHGGSVGFQTQNQYQADNNNTTSASAAGSLSPRSFASNDTGYNSCPCITNSGRSPMGLYSSHHTRNSGPSAAKQGVGLWQISGVRWNSSAFNPARDPVTGRNWSSRGFYEQTTRLDETEMELDEDFDWEPATERRNPGNDEGWSEAPKEPQGWRNVLKDPKVESRRKLGFVVSAEAQHILGDIPSLKLFESDKILAFLDINPLSRGHALVIPKFHGAKLTDIPDDQLSEILPVVKKLVTATGAENYNVLQNNGKIAHQEVDHVHFHMIPKPNVQEGLTVGWPQQKTDMDKLKALLAEVQAKM
ncbi:hypothetical protein V493_05131 [Pseudogymnoascus sp. VKM F-4281 (FW-2241)]|nr:hypothetical protein V493_05131 [Pseudogymnoascus sp. VKM F-4281 (FW-2241)]